MLCADRLVEIATNRFPAKFSVEAAQTDLCSQVHVFTELTCQNLLARCCDVAAKVHSLTEDTNLQSFMFTWHGYF